MTDLTRTQYPCPGCGATVEAGDRYADSRIRCKACGRRSVLKHEPEWGPDCWPECFDRSHWRLGRKVTQ